MPFGLASAVQLLARLTKPICIFLAKEGIRLSIYIDDGWILALLRELAIQHLQRVLSVMQQAGFVFSIEKSDTPEDISQKKKHLGFHVDSSTMTISAQDSKLNEVKTLFFGRGRRPGGLTAWAQGRHTNTGLAALSAPRGLTLSGTVCPSPPIIESPVWALSDRLRWGSSYR